LSARLRGTGESAYSTLIQKHIPGNVEQAFGLRPIPDSFCAAPFLRQNPQIEEETRFVEAVKHGEDALASWPAPCSASCSLEASP
jgi:hypothetical protein